MDHRVAEPRAADAATASECRRRDAEPGREHRCTQPAGAAAPRDPTEWGVRKNGSLCGRHLQAVWEKTRFDRPHTARGPRRLRGHGFAPRRHLRGAGTKHSQRGVIITGWWLAGRNKHRLKTRTLILKTRRTAAGRARCAPMGSGRAGSQARGAGGLLGDTLPTPEPPGHAGTVWPPGCPGTAWPPPNLRFYRPAFLWSEERSCYEAGTGPRTCPSALPCPPTVRSPGPRCALAGLTRHPPPSSEPSLSTGKGGRRLGAGRERPRPRQSP